MKKILFICVHVHVMCVYTTTTLLQVGFVIISSSIIPVVHVMLVPLRAIKTGRGYIFEKFLRNIKSLQ